MSDSVTGCQSFKTSWRRQSDSLICRRLSLRMPWLNRSETIRVKTATAKRRYIKKRITKTSKNRKRIRRGLILEGPPSTNRMILLHIETTRLIAIMKAAILEEAKVLENLNLMVSDATASTALITRIRTDRTSIM
jgi:hypothetical protein